MCWMVFPSQVFSSVSFSSLIYFLICWFCRNCYHIVRIFLPSVFLMQYWGRPSINYFAYISLYITLEFLNIRHKVASLARFYQHFFGSCLQELMNCDSNLFLPSDYLNLQGSYYAQILYISFQPQNKLLCPILFPCHGSIVEWVFSCGWCSIISKEALTIHTFVEAQHHISWQVTLNLKCSFLDSVY